MKKLLASALLSTAMLATMVHPANAIYDPSRPPAKPGEVQILSAQPPSQDDQFHYYLVINGKEYTPEESKVKIHPNQEKIMLPLRTVAHALGYQIAWQPKEQKVALSKESQQLTVKAGDGTAKIEQGTTFVPLSYVRDTLQTQVTVAKTGMITIAAKDQAQVQEQMLGTLGEITEVTTTADGGKRIAIQGKKMGEHGYDQIILHIDEDTQIISKQDMQPVSVDQLQKGLKVQAMYDSLVTKSFPPIGKAVKIIVEM